MSAFWIGLVLGALIAAGVGFVLRRRPGDRLSSESMRLIRQLDSLATNRGPTAVFTLAHPKDPGLAALAAAVDRLSTRIDQEWRRLRDEAALGASVVQASPNGVLVADRDGRIRAVNPAVGRLIPIRGQPVGRLPVEVIDVPEVQQAVEIVLSGRPVDEIPCTAGRLHLLLKPMRIDSGALVVIEDITRFRLAERVRTEFVANVSHELRTPIATLMGYAETLADERERLSPEHAAMADVLLRNARRLRDLFEDLLELSRIEARREELPLSEVLLRPVLEQAVAAAADLAERRKQQFVLQCEAEQKAWINAEAVTTMIRNLATNATNYTPEGGHIRVRAHRVEDEVLLEVKDDGLGIDRAHHERIFERFYRVDEGRSRRVGGTGLGLAIVKHLGLASGCRVTVDSEVGKGSTFTVHLPTRTAIRR
jgi:two-component system phosphate regulon sensor histidine kinase PhoR